MDAIDIIMALAAIGLAFGFALWVTFINPQEKQRLARSDAKQGNPEVKEKK